MKKKSRLIFNGELLQLGFSKSKRHNVSTMNICISTYASDNNRHIVHVCDTGTHDLHALHI